MRARIASVALATVLLLSGCDLFGASDDSVSGYWEGTASFSADTILVAQNFRLKGDYEFTFAFDLTLDDGLVEGQVREFRQGEIQFREAGFQGGVVTFEPGTVYRENFSGGTFVEPELELDVETEAYSDDLFTFEVIGSRADSDNYILHDLRLTRQINGNEFNVTLRSDEPLTIYRKDRPDVDETAPLAPEAQRGVLRTLAASRLHRSEQ